MNNDILNKILIAWGDSDIEDSGLIKVSDVENRMKYQLIYKVDELKKIKIFNISQPSLIYKKYKDKIYINGEHVELDQNGYTVNEYKPGEYRVYIDGFNKHKKINGRTFLGCTDLISIEIPSSVTRIGESAFASCAGLTLVIIPNSVILIGDDAFYNCSGLTEVTIPNSVTKIGEGAFNGCRGLTKIEIPDSVISIGEGAFSRCFDLTSVTIPTSVTMISKDVFSGCRSLTSITIPNSVTIIGKYAFSFCSGLTSVIIPNSVTKISDLAFWDCPNIKTIYVESIDKFNKIQFLGRRDKSKLFKNAELIELKQGLNEALLQWDDSDIEDSGLIKASDVENRMKYQLVYKVNKQKRIKIFHGKESASFTNKFKNKVYLEGEHIELDQNGYTANEYKPGKYRVYIEDFDKLKKIYNGGVFYKCTDLISVTIPNSVIKIGNWAFNSCWSLTSVIIPNSVKTIGEGAFCGCSSLTSVTIPNSVIEIEERVFCGCSDLTSVTIGNSVTRIGKDVFSDCTSLTSVTIPNSVTSIGYYAFYCCRSLTSVTIPNSVTKIDNNAFRDCTSLTSVTIPNSVTSIGSHAFYRCPNLKTIYVENISKFKKIKFLGYGDKTELLRNVKLVKKQRLNEALLQWNDSDVEDSGGILSKDDIKYFISVPTIDQIIKKLKTMLTKLPKGNNSRWDYYVAPRSFNQICEIFKAFNPNIKIYWENCNGKPEGALIYGIDGIIKIAHPCSSLWEDSLISVSSSIDYTINGEKTFVEVPCLFCRLRSDETWNIYYGITKNGEWYHAGWSSMENNIYNDINGPQVWAMRENSSLRTFAIYIQGILKIYADPSLVNKKL